MAFDPSVVQIPHQTKLSMFSTWSFTLAELSHDAVSAPAPPSSVS
jgi:hypothetical protein